MRKLLIFFALLPLLGISAAYGDLLHEDLLEARQSFDNVSESFESSNMLKFNQGFSSNMIGRQIIIDSANQSSVKIDQINLQFSQARTLKSSKTVILDLSWKRRALRIPTNAPTIKSGFCIVIMQKENSLWKISAMAGDNPFSP
jgi:hypothetical protein